MNVERSDTLDGTTYIMTESHTYSEILQRLREIEPRAVPIKHVGERAADFQRARADLTRSRDVLGYEPTVNLHEGLERYVIWAGNNLRISKD